MDEARIVLAPCPDEGVAGLRRELGLHHVTAQALVRRGFAQPAAAAAFLAGAERHDPRRFAGIERAAALILGHVRAHSPIAVHGDYDVDGVCATAVLVRALRALGARVRFCLPDRARDGYGLSARTVQRLAGSGARLLITVDCGITAAAEVAEARARGMDVIVTDHHAPPAGELPQAHIVHPALCSYPCAELCATAVAYKLAQVLTARARDGGAAGTAAEAVERDLDLVALATIADSVPLLGENRALVRAGLRALAGTRKSGLRALMSCAGVEPARLDERAVAFALAPRLNAAGRLYRADAALELLLAEEPSRAQEIARELDRANTERKDAQTRVLFEAEAQVSSLSERAAYVLAGERWHPGVIGIVASRLVERHHRPFVLIALDGELGRGSGRSIEAFDLVAALASCERHLRRHGGHRAAAGLEVERSQLQRFGAAFAAHARQALTPRDLTRQVTVDAIAAVDELSLELADELGALAPFGQGNPPVSLLVPQARVTGVRTMGEGRHLRFTLCAGEARMNAVAFGFGRPALRRMLAEEAMCDGVFRLEVNEWRGVTEPRLSLAHIVRAQHASPGAPASPYPVEHGQGEHPLAS